MAEGTGKISDGYYAIAEELRRRKEPHFSCALKSTLRYEKHRKWGI